MRRHNKKLHIFHNYFHCLLDKRHFVWYNFSGDVMYFIGLDIGGTKCAVTLGKSDGQLPEILNKIKFPTADCASPFEVMEKMLAYCGEVLSGAKLTYGDISAIGISCGGPLNSKTGVILSPPNLPGWDNIEIVRFFEEKTGVKTYLQNDANACAVAEWKYGAGKGTENMIFLTFGTGLGAGLILNGRLFCGASDMAGEIGHVRLREEGPVGYGKRGSCEGFCSGAGIRKMGITAVEEQLQMGNTPRLYEAAGRDINNITAKLIGDLAEQENDPMCLKIYRDCGKKLGETLSVLIDLFNPELIVLGGIYMRSSGLLEEYINAVIEKETLAAARNVCRVVPAGLSEKIGDYAALSIAADEFERSIK